jgi:hypothetical protein
MVLLITLFVIGIDSYQIKLNYRDLSWYSVPLASTALKCNTPDIPERMSGPDSIKEISFEGAGTVLIANSNECSHDLKQACVFIYDSNDEKSQGGTCYICVFIFQFYESNCIFLYISILIYHVVILQSPTAFSMAEVVCNVLSCPVLSYPVLSCPVLSCPVVLCNLACYVELTDFHFIIIYFRFLLLIHLVIMYCIQEVKTVIVR